MLLSLLCVFLLGMTAGAWLSAGNPVTLGSPAGRRAAATKAWRAWPLAL